MSVSEVIRSCLAPRNSKSILSRKSNLAVIGNSYHKCVLITSSSSFVFLFLFLPSPFLLFLPCFVSLFVFYFHFFLSFSSSAPPFFYFVSSFISVFPISVFFSYITRFFISSSLPPACFSFYISSSFSLASEATNASTELSRISHIVFVESCVGNCLFHCKELCCRLKLKIWKQEIRGKLWSKEPRTGKVFRKVKVHFLLVLVDRNWKLAKIHVYVELAKSEILNRNSSHYPV